MRYGHIDRIVERSIRVRQIKYLSSGGRLVASLKTGWIEFLDRWSSLPAIGIVGKRVNSGRRFAQALEGDNSQ